MGVSLDHDLDKRLVDHVHLFLAVPVSEVHLLSTYDGRQVRQVSWNRPVQGNIGERRLCPPAGRRVDAIDKGLDTFLHFRIRQVICLYKRRKIGIKGGEGLRACPLVLHDTKEVYHLVAQHAQMLGR